jgi:hypothetical protein
MISSRGAGAIQLLCFFSFFQVSSFIPQAFLSQLPTTTPLSMGNWIVDLAAIATLVLVVLAIWQRIASKFPPAMPDYCERMHKALKNDLRVVIQEELAAAETTHTERTTELRKEINTSITGVHKRVDTIILMLKKGSLE